MTTVVEALDRIARRCSITPPTSWVSATGLSHVQIRDDYLLETIDDLRKRVNWPSPIGAQTTITGDGSSEDFALPASFARMQFGEEAFFETANVRRFGIFVQTDGDWTNLKQVGGGAGGRYYRIKGYDGAWEVSVYPILSATETVTISYITDYWKATAAGTAGDTFSDETDLLLYPRRPVELGTIARWRKSNGLDFEQYAAEYEAYIATTSNRLNGRLTINFGEAPRVKPGRAPLPDYIPSS